ATVTLTGGAMMQGDRPRSWRSTMILPTLMAGSILLAPAVADAGFPAYKAKRTEASFTSGDATIKVWQFTPTEGKGPWPGVVLLYGLDGLDEFKTTQLFYNIIGGKIAEKGLVVQLVFYFDRIPFKAAEVPKLKLALQKQLLDLEQK